MNCNICGKNFSNKSNLNSHQKTAKFCLKLQQKTNESYECFRCKKNFSKKGYLEKHQQKCDSNINNEIIETVETIKREKDAEYETLKHEIIILKENNVSELSCILEKHEKIINTVNKQNTELQKKIETYLEKLEQKENSIKELKYRERELKELQKLKEETYKNQIQKYENNIKDLQNKLERLASGKSIVNHNNINSNNVRLELYLTPEFIHKQVEENLTHSHLMDGVRGIVKFAFDFILKDPETGQLLYVCVDSAREVFKFRNENGEEVKDVKAGKLASLMSPEVRKKLAQAQKEIAESNCLQREIIENPYKSIIAKEQAKKIMSDNDYKMQIFVDKSDKLFNLEENNFSKELTKLVC